MKFFLSFSALMLCLVFSASAQIDTTHKTSPVKARIGVAAAAAAFVPSGLWAIEALNTAGTTMFQSIYKPDAVGVGDHIFRFLGPNGNVFSVNSIDPAYGKLISQFGVNYSVNGVNYSVNGVNGVQGYAVNANKYAPFIEMNAEDGSISLYGESGTLVAGAARTVYDKTSPGYSTVKKGLCIKGTGNVEFEFGLKFNALNLNSTAQAANGKTLSLDANGNVILVTSSGGGTSSSPWTLNTSTNHINNNNTGAVVIGTGITAFPASFKLFVAGSILTERVKVAVKNTANWADFVFAPNYRLASLASVEKYIDQHHHLPDVPSAQAVVSNGLDLAENQAKLLQKIEELTLYVIAQD